MSVLFNIRRKYARRGASERVNIAEATITLSANSFVYTGEAITPAVTVTYKGETLELDRDYFLSYGDNMAIGRGYATVTGDGMYKGTARAYFYITAAEPEPTPGWGFDLSNSVYVGQSALHDETAMFESTQDLACLRMNPMADGRILICADLQGHSYVWGFEDGKEFDVDGFKSTFDSRSPGEGYHRGVEFNGDGTRFYDICMQYSFQWSKSISGSPYDLSSAGGRESGRVLNINTKYEFLHFSTDGKTAIYKSATRSVSEDKEISMATYSEPFPSQNTITHDSLYTVDLSQFDGSLGETGTVHWRGFTLSPDGKFLVATTRESVVKFELADPFDIHDMTLKSKVNLSSHFSAVFSLMGVAINSEGSKMIAVVRETNTGYGSYFIGLNLR